MDRIRNLKQEIAELVARAPDRDDTYVRAADRLAGLVGDELPVLRIAILRSFTIEPLVEVLKVKGFLDGFRVELFLSEFNQYQQEIVDPDSRLYQCDPSVIFIAVRLEELEPTFFTAYAHRTPEELEQAQRRVLNTIRGWIERIGQRSPAPILLSNFLVPFVGAQGLYDTQVPTGQVTVIRALNAKLVELRAAFRQLHLFDVELLAGSVGKEVFCDARQWARMSSPYRLSAYPAYGDYLLRHVNALLGCSRKCLVLDLDDTLWGGTVAEDGIAGVLLSDTYPGNCFQEFQRAILRLYDRGVLLAVNSKNNAEDALEMIRSHPHMILREEHFSALRINWKDKVENLQDVARALNLGLDALVFMDDSAVECERVRQACPEVLVVQLPSQRHAYRATLEGLGCFDQVRMTGEDRSRSIFYRGRAQREALASSAATLEAFYASLQMRGVLGRNERSHIPRVAQMTQKTNQFNLTTKRYHESDIVRFMDDGMVYTLQIQDRFGDNGIIATAIVVPREGSEWHIDSFLMSCRVIMRTIEDSLLAQIVSEAKAHGVRWIVGLFIATEKNQMVKEFYQQHGFAIRARLSAGGTEYALDLDQGILPRPSPWIAITETAESLPSPSAVALS